jgi:hypothetical protein
LILINSMMDGCFGIAPISSSLCVIDTAFAPLPADGAGAELAADGAAEVPVLVWLGGADSVLDWEVGASGVSVGCVVVGAVATGAGAGIAGVETADVTGLTGLTGDSTLVGFVTDFTQVSEDVTQSPHKGCP